MGYSFKVVYPDPKTLADAGYTKVADIPCILDSRPGYHRLGSRFLIDRALGIWDPAKRGREQQPRIPTKTSVRNYADRLANFLEWCDVRNVEPLNVEYVQDLIGRYRREMISGSWSAHNRSLSPTTINVRINTAADFLLWCVDKGLRPEFVIPTTTKVVMIENAKSSTSHLGTRVETRKGKMRETRKRLSFPPDEELANWFNAIAQKPVVGGTESLIVDTILQTAIRREEAACLRVDTLPLKKSDWNIDKRNAPIENQAVLVEIQYGCKGESYGEDHGDKIGPSGTIRIPLPLANRLHEYREKVRPKSLMVAVKKGKNLAEQKKIREDAVHLFFRPDTGGRYTGEKVYEIWRTPPRLKKWSPHLARDYWACMYLLRRMNQQKELLKLALGSGVSDEILNSLRSDAQTIIQLEIQPQLRHKSSETTLIYLQWLADHFAINLDPHQTWLDSLGE